MINKNCELVWRHKIISNNKIKRDCSCAICGFFYKNETDENSGYCLMHEDTEIQGENFKIPDGEEKNTAAKCPMYHRRISSFSHADFLNWRTNILINDIEKKFAQSQNKMANILMWLTALIAILTVIQVIWLLIKW